ncbi:hydrogenase maturation protease [Nitrosomonas oligotropha]|uniref:Hydrogenase maturation protease n=1 Tax=Nitrosomonas oligotropha TaxID=42354 RepID=A0A1H8MIZ0_9PROT|nr:hydrogenase maturation protease [Nitrosomonas oligotropha]SDW45909.1 hydrogenase maturation protease [Nitrosomonas oligotropha]SEO17106.1 hydrogenase maturation protease [Nitrosomonas oligotropha]
MNKLLLLGYGNPGRGDDALGPLLVEHIAQLQLADVACLVDMQLLIEHAADLTDFDRIIFVDADMSCQEPFEFSTVTAEKDASYTSHALTPAAVLYVYQQIHSHAAPPAILLRIRGYRFELGDYLSMQANENLAAAILKIQQWIPQQQ